MTRNFLFAIAAAAALGACSPPKAAKCSQNSDCPADAICVSGICQKGAPSGGAGGLQAGAAHMTAGTKTMDVVLGEPISPSGAADTKQLAPAQNTR